MASDQMRKVDLVKDAAHLQQPQLDYMKLLEKQNFERVIKLKRIRRNNLLTGAALAVSVFGIYAYSIVAVKQEKFLDELDTPTPSKSPQ